MLRMHVVLFLVWVLQLAGLPGSGVAAAEKLRALIVDGQNNHNWKATTPILHQQLEASGRFAVDVATSPPQRHDMSAFRPKFGDYDVVVSNYNGDRWSKQAEQDFLNYVRRGGGFVVVHAANNSFADWPEYNELIGLGGWGGRNEKWGPYVYFREGQLVRDPQAGSGGHHGRQHEFAVDVRDAEHPITRGMPAKWMHARDELYDKLRGPAENMRVLATAYADPATGGSGRHEPMMMVLRYGEGRVFHTPMGHADYSMQCVGFAATLVRGAEWAARGEVTIELPADFPGAEAVVSTTDRASEKVTAWTNLLPKNDVSRHWVTKGNWSSDDEGVVTLTPRPGERGWSRFDAYLWSKREYDDFEIQFDYRVEERGNSGFYFNVGDKESPVERGIEVQIYDSYGKEEGKKLSDHDSGGIIPGIPPSKNPAKPAGDWNRFHIKVEGNQLLVKLNGKVVNEVNLAEQPRLKDRPEKGYIGFQDHALPLALRRIRIREL